MYKKLKMLLCCSVMTLCLFGNSVYALDAPSDYEPTEEPGVNIADEAYIEWTLQQDRNAIANYHPQAPERVTQCNKMRRGTLVGQAWASDGLAYFKQADYSNVIPGCGKTIADVGCALTASAEVLSKWGWIDPPTLMNAIGDAGFDGCSLIWSAAARVKGVSHKQIPNSGGSEANGMSLIRGQLEAGNPVIVKLVNVNNRNHTHYVVCYGYETYLENGQYITYHYIHNPGGSDVNTLEGYFMDNYWIDNLNIFY